MRTISWNTPQVALACGGLILLLAIGIRQSLGLFLQPLSAAHGWGRETFAFAIALQNLVWGLAQPFAGMVADRMGAGRMVVLGGLFYAAGLALTAFADSGFTLCVAAGVLVGLGLSGAGFGVVMGVIGRNFDAQQRSAALGLVSAGGSVGQFVMLPYGQFMLNWFDWQGALLALALTATIIVPLAAGLAGRPAAQRSGAPEQSIATAIVEAGTHKGFWLLTFSFLVCGFQTTFMMIHLPAYLVDQGMSPVAGMSALALIGLTNIGGAYLCGWLGGHYSKKRLLGGIYLLRTLAILAYISFPVTVLSTCAFAVVFGATFLGTVPVTNALVAQIFGVRYLSTLFSIAFLGHQLGSFLGSWLGGRIFDASGSYMTVWLIAAGLSVIAAAACWPIDERELRTPALRENVA